MKTVRIMVVSLFICCFLSNCNKVNKPNILFIAVDDLRPELACYGNDYVISPNIDKMAADGIQFNRAYCQSAVCNPSRASLMTGLRPNTTRVLDLWTDLRKVSPNVVTLPQYFKQNGYYTNAIGKIYHNIFPDTLSWSEDKLYIAGYPFDPDAVYRDSAQVAWLEERKKELIAQGKAQRHIDRFGEWYLKAGAFESPDVPDNAYFDGAQTDLAIDKLAEYKDKQKPFFFAVGYYRPHLPFNVPKKYWDMYDPDKIPPAENDFLPKDSPLMAINNMRELRGYKDFKHVTHPRDGKLTPDESRTLKHGYLASVSYIDTQIGRLLKALDDLGLRQNTIIVLWGDHGWKLGEHNSWAKMTNYEIDARVPLIISTPQTMQRRIRSDALVEFVDIYPTLCELAALPVPDGLEGVSMCPLISNPNRPWKTAAFTQFLREGIWSAPDGIEYMGYSLRTDRYRYVEWQNWQTGQFVANELYDHVSDPQENRNVAKVSENHRLVDSLSVLLKKGWRGALPLIKE